MLDTEQVHSGLPTRIGPRRLSHCLGSCMQSHSPVPVPFKVPPLACSTGCRSAGRQALLSVFHTNSGTPSAGSLPLIRQTSRGSSPSLFWGLSRQLLCVTFGPFWSCPLLLLTVVNSYSQEVSLKPCWRQEWIFLCKCVTLLSPSLAPPLSSPLVVMCERQDEINIEINHPLEIQGLYPKDFQRSQVWKVHCSNFTI